MNNDVRTLREKAARYRRLAGRPDGQGAVFELLEIAAYFEAQAVRQEAAATKGTSGAGFGGARRRLRAAGQRLAKALNRSS